MQPVQSSLFVLFASCINLSFAAPAAIPISAPAPTPAPTLDQLEAQRLDKRDVIGSILSDLGNLGGPSPSAVNPNIFSKILGDFNLAVATEAPIAISAASRTISSILSNPTPPNLFEFAGELVAAGLTSQNGASAVEFAAGVLLGADSESNLDLRIPLKTIYPKASSKDAPYTLSEAQLRSVIYIPPTFKYGAWGAPPPVILIPGTGSTGYSTYVGNFIALLQQNPTVADPIWLNIPDFLNDDAQVNSEYVAYAINYISSICGNQKIAIAGWSQGNVNAHWAFKYWPSTRSKVCDHISMSADFHGTIVAYFAATPDIPLPQAYIQQAYTSNFVKTLLSNGGDSAYVPTTNIYSGLVDEIVEPQQGANASGRLLDARNVGVSNTELQSVCPGQPASSFYTHEGVLYNPISWALFVDALANSGPGQVSRINKNICGLYLTQGLDLTDLLLTENTLLSAAVTFALNPYKSLTEAPIMSYALSH